MQNDIEGFEPPKHGYLLGWAKQGELSLAHKKCINFMNIQTWHRERPMSPHDAILNSASSDLLIRCLSTEPQRINVGESGLDNDVYIQQLDSYLKISSMRF